ncbi:hypothetical protein AB0C84_41930 [Actinomadura sp. NPDC048955]|uniref:VMAP-C domain-containing protein n=1 Tax=Actinomadura sp. NPDC048955 TaxID=3158228 RepID=UPI0033F2B009
MLNPADAVVFAVGIERYGFGDELPGASAEAVRFVEWALLCGVPPDRVTLACDSLEGARPKGVRLVGTSRHEIEKALVELSRLQGELLLFFWCGHGVVDEEHRRVLFTSDAVPDDLRNISVDHLLDYLASSSLGEEFRRQFLLIDACANFVAEHALPNRVPIATFPKGGQREVEQFTYFSAAQGQRARFDRVQRHAFFSRIALRWLHDNVTSLPPDSKKFVEEVNGEFDRLRLSEELRHTPVYRRIKRGPGHEDVLHDGVRPVSGTAQERIRASGLTLAQAQRVMDAMANLRGVPANLLERFDLGMVERILSSLASCADEDTERLAIRQAQVCLQRQRWIAPALARFGAVTLDHVRHAYHSAAPEGDTGLPTDLDQALDMAAAYGPRPGHTAPLHRMTAILEHLTGRRLDDDWYGLPADQLAALRRRAAEPRPQSARLIIDLRVPGTALVGWPTEMVGHLYLPGRNWTQRQVTCLASQTGARQAVNQLLDWAYGHSAALTLGMIVPRAVLDAVPEAWPYEDSLTEPIPLWQEHPTVLHCAERLSNRRALSGWRDRTTAIKKRLPDLQPEVQWLEPSDAREITLAVRRSTAACMGLRFPLPPYAADNFRRDPIIASIVGGAPYLLWWDTEPDDWADAEKSLRYLAAGGRFEDLPERLHRLRVDDRDGLGGSLRVIWDAPDCLPPLTELTGLSGSTARRDSHG